MGTLRPADRFGAKARFGEAVLFDGFSYLIDRQYGTRVCDSRGIVRVQQHGHHLVGEKDLLHCGGGRACPARGPGGAGQRAPRGSRGSGCSRSAAIRYGSGCFDCRALRGGPDPHEHALSRYVVNQTTVLIAHLRYGGATNGGSN